MPATQALERGSRLRKQGKNRVNVTGKRATQVSERRTSTYYLDFNTLLLNTTKTHRGPQY